MIKWNRLLLIPALLLTLGAGGCASLDKVRDAAQAITAEIQNPIDRNDIARAESLYEAALIAAVSYRRYCYSRPLAELPAACKNRRTVLLTLQSADKKAYTAIQSAKKFVADNPRVSAVSVVTAARQAVQEYYNAAALVAQ
jgi:hypothetical protein